MSRTFTPPVDVQDGDVARAADVNNVKDATNTACTLLEAEIDAIPATVETYTNKAQEWAEQPEDTEVEPGKYSSLHHAAKSEDSATSSASSASTATSAAASATASASSASTSESNAASSASSASTSALEAAASAEEAAEQPILSIKKFGGY